MARKRFSPAYHAYMRSQVWKLRRHQCLMRYRHRCAACGTRGRLQVHHLTYVRFGQELPTDLIPLCVACHKVADVIRKMGKRS